MNGVGLMLGVDQSGAELYTETTKGTVEIGERHKDWTTLEGGVGVSEDDGTAASAHSALYAGARIDDAGYADGVGGGVDIRFGVVTQGPEVVAHDMGSATPIRKLVAWQGSYYMALGAALVKSTTPDFSGSPSIVQTFDSDIVDMLGWAGVASPPELRIALRYGPMYVYDGTTLVPDGAPDGRGGPITAFYRDDAGSLTDYTSEVTDGNPATAADLGGLATATGYAYVGVASVFEAASLKMGADNNTVPAIVGADFWDEETQAWAPLVMVEDTTESPAGTSLGLGVGGLGHIQWRRPDAKWGLLALTTGGTPYYYARLHWSANLSGAVTLDTISQWGRMEADALGVVEERLVISSGGNTFYWTDEGGGSPTWNAAVKYAPNTAEVVGITTVQRAAYIVRTDGVFTVDRDGLPAQLMRFDPPAASRDGVPLCAWLDQAYLGYGGRNLVQFSPNPGGVAKLEAMGPDRLNMDIPAGMLPTVTAAVADRTHFLYAVANDPSGIAQLACWGTYSETRDAVTGEFTWTRHDAWTVLAELRSRTVLSMATWTHADGRPWLLMGDSLGKLLAVRLPRGRSPLGDGGYRYTTVDGVLVYPVFRGDDPERPLVVYAAEVDGVLLSAGRTATVQVSAPGSGAVLGAATFVAVADEALALDVPYSGRGVVVRLVLATDDATTAPVLKRVGLIYQGAIKAMRRVIECTVLADDDVRDRRGALIDYSAADWQAKLDAATANVPAGASTRKPLAFTRRGGGVTKVLVQGRRDAAARRRETRQPASAVALILVSAE